MLFPIEGCWNLQDGFSRLAVRRTQLTHLEAMVDLAGRSKSQAITIERS
jgi:hypothetical protein